ncbi:arf-GAP domain and FG repeat-containing protein 1 isoform X2 [Neocloeon triangulifer]|uniref:arf-GAP domain and FG repeat-containing protein 1 isoform X2 n=1 Tax=Neocloeon triangulifer TaxID=2078957 RepID=UPI00286F1F70|nr:arf-GAP domain and FG repeat-containing protein 1 isoform X2 [Neocloeon triangulifer]
MRSKKEEATVVPPAAVDDSPPPDSLALQESLANKLEEMATKKKQDEKNLKLLRELTSMACNKHCFDCQQRGPTYVNMTIGSFVCTTCSGLLRGLTPPHRVKSISMTSFTDEEITLLKSRGNEYCRRVWLGLYDPAQETDVSDDCRVKQFMVNKYERKRYYLDPSKISLPKPAPSPQLPLPQQTTTPLAKPSMALPRTVPHISSPNNNMLIKADPFLPLSNVPQPPQDNFANFDNAPIFNALVAQNSSPAKNQSNIPNSFSTPPMTIVGNGGQSEDRYAALKDLDSLMKGATISSSPFTNGGGGSIFDSPMSQNQSTPMFLSPDSTISSSTISSPSNPFAAASSPSRNNTNPWGTPPTFSHNFGRATNPFESITTSPAPPPATNSSSELSWNANFQDAFNGGSAFSSQENNKNTWGFMSSNANNFNNSNNGLNSVSNGFNNPFTLGGNTSAMSSNPFL